MDDFNINGGEWARHRLAQVKTRWELHIRRNFVNGRRQELPCNRWSSTSKWMVWKKSSGRCNIGRKMCRRALAENRRITGI